MSSHRAQDKHATTAASDLADEAGPGGPGHPSGRDAGHAHGPSPLEALGDFRSIDPHSGVKRGLKTRHLSMMALAGIIGPGLLVGSGGALASGGPASLLIGFGVVGVVAFSVMQSLGELTTLYPAEGGLAGLADRFVDKAFGVAVGWNYFIIWVAVLANEYNTLCSILVFWSDRVPLWGYFLILWFVFLGFQLLGVEAFGEVEFWLALLKLGGLVAFFLFSIVYASGGVPGAPALGFAYWRDPGAFAGSGARGVATVFVFCSTFYAGCESVAVAAAETRNPGAAVPRAVRQVFWRILVVYMGSALFFGLTCPSDAPGLVGGDGAGANAGKALQSPMTVALGRAGWPAGVHLVNAFILATCLSAVGSSLYVGSRTLLHMGRRGQAPRALGRADARGVPVPAVVLTNLCGALGMLNVSTGAAAAYGYIVRLSGVSTFLVWGSAGLVHLRFRAAWRAQGRAAADLPFAAWGFPWTAYFGLAANVFLALVQGWATLRPFDAAGFVDAYVLLPLFPVIYVAYKLVYKTRLWRVEEMDLLSGRRRDLDEVRKLAAGGGGGLGDLPSPWWKRFLRNI